MRRIVECRVRMTKAEHRVLLDGAADADIPLARYIRELALGVRQGPRSSPVKVASPQT